MRIKNKHEIEYVLGSIINANTESRWDLEKLKKWIVKLLEEKEEIYWKNAKLEADCRELKERIRYLERQIFSGNAFGAVNFDGLKFHINEVKTPFDSHDRGGMSISNQRRD